MYPHSLQTIKMKDVIYMIFKAVLSNKAHPEYGQVTIPLPIPDSEYGYTIELLEGLDIGSPTDQDCQVDELICKCPILDQLVTQSVNVDELDYLAKRLYGFDKGEWLQFQAMASALSLSDVKDLINLTFCCQQATVIADFSDLEQVGKNHQMNLSGGSMPMDEYQKLDGQRIALDLIQSGTGVVTPYGVAYDNGMELNQVYDGRHLPEYYYEPCVVTVKLTPIGRPKEQEFLYFPCPPRKIKRAVQRLGAEEPWQCRADLDPNEIYDVIRSLFEDELELNEHLGTLNRLTRYYQDFMGGEIDKFHIVFDTICPQTPKEAVYLAEHLLDFVVIEGINTAEEYGRYIAKEMRVDAKVQESVNFFRLGQHRIDEEGGVFGDMVYVAYRGSQPEIQEIMARHVPSGQESQMGGLNL